MSGAGTRKRESVCNSSQPQRAFARRSRERRGGYWVEPLEDRRLLAVTASVTNGTLSVNLFASGDIANLALNANQQIVVTNGAAQNILTTAASGVTSLSVTGTATGTQTVNLNSAFTFSVSATTSQLSDITVGGALSAGSVNFAASNNITLNASLTTSGTINLNADSDSNGFGTLLVASGTTVSATGHTITAHAATLTLSGTVNAAAGSVNYSFSPNFSISNGLSHTVSSGTVTFSQTTSGSPFNFADSSPAGLTGIVVLNFPLSPLSTSGINTSAGKAALQITAASITTTGALNTGTAPLTLNATDVVIGGAVTCGTITVTTPDSITVNANLTASGVVTLTADSDNSGAGTLTVASGVTINSSGNNIVTHEATLSNGGTLSASAGNITFSFSNPFSITATGSMVSSGTLTFEQLTASGSIDLGLTFGAGTTGTVVLDFPLATFTVTAADTSAGNANLQITAASVTTSGAIKTGTGALTINATDVTLGAAVTCGAVTVTAPDSITVNANLTASGVVALTADSDSNNAGTLAVASGVTINAQGHNVVGHAATLSNSGTISAGVGNITFSFSPVFSITPGGSLVSSGTVTYELLSTSGSLDLGLTFGSGTTGTVVLDFPLVNFTVTNADTSAGNANLQITAASVTTSGAIKTGTGALTINATDVTLGAAVTCGAVTVTAPDSITVNANVTASGAVTLTADSDDNSVGALNVASGVTINSEGHNVVTHAATLADSGTVIAGAGNITFSFSPSFSSPAVGPLASSATVTFEHLTGAGSTSFGAAFGAGVTGTVVLDYPSNSLTANIDTSAGNANLQITAASVTTGAIKTGTGALTINATDVTIGGAVSSGLTTVATPDSITVNANITASGVVTLDADSDSNGVGTLTVASGDTVNSTGHNVVTHQATLANSGTVNAGAGNITFSFSPSASIASLGTLVSSATVTIEQLTAGGSDSLGVTFGAGVTGTVVLDFPLAAFTVTSAVTSVGNANLDVMAASITLDGPIVAGTGTITLNSTDGVTQSGGSIAGAGLVLFGGQFTLNQAANAVSTLAAQVTGPLQFTDAGALTVGTVAGTPGIITQGTAVTLSAGGALTTTAPINTGAGGLSLAGADVTIGGAITCGAITVATPDTITVNANVTAAGTVTLTADSDSNGAGTLAIGSGVTVSSTGHDISTHQATLNINGTVNAGGGNITYAFSPASGLTSLGDTISSGTVTLSISAPDNAGLTLATDAGITGTFILDLPLTNFSTNGLNTSAGNANLQIIAATTAVSGPLNAGTGTITLSDSTSATIAAGASFAASSLTFTGGGAFAIGVDVGSVVLSITGAGTSAAFNITQHVSALALSGGASASLAAGGAVELFTNALSVVGAVSKLDVSNDAVQIAYTAGNDPVAQIRQMLSTGYAGGAWNGAGIMTSKADAAHGLGFADSVDGIDAALPANTLLIKWTRYGDANLDGSVNFSDLVALAQHYNTASGANWDQGDFNYDGKVNFTDLVALAQNYGGTAVPAAVSASASAALTSAAPAAADHRRRPARHSRGHHHA